MLNFIKQKQWRLFIFIPLLTLFLYAQACKTTEPTPPVQNPPGYQEDIPWLSLADSPWPAWHHDMQSTGRTPLSAPDAIHNIETITIGITESDIVAGNDGVLYFADNESPSYLNAYSLNSGVFWRKAIGKYDPVTSPLLLRDNKIIISSDSNKTFLISTDSNTLWVYNNSSINYNRRIGVDLEGNFYFIENENTLAVLNSDGALLWQLYDEDIIGGVRQVPVFSPDGKTLYLQGENSSLIAIDIKTRNIKWRYGYNPGADKVIPTITNEGYIVVTEPAEVRGSQLVLLNPDGVVQWKYKISSFHLGYLEPGVDYHGNIYCGIDTLYSINLNGKINWKKDLQNDDMRLSSIVIDGANRVYFSATNYKNESYVYCFSSSGELLWRNQFDAINGLGNPAIISDGILAVPTYNSYNGDKIYLIK